MRHVQEHTLEGFYVQAVVFEVVVCLLDQHGVLCGRYTHKFTGEKTHAMVLVVVAGKNYTQFDVIFIRFETKLSMKREILTSV